MLLTIGVAGFIPGLTTHYQHLSLTGWRSPAEVFGLFTASIVQNLVHVALGFVGVAAARTPSAARWYLGIAGALNVAAWLCVRSFGRDGAVGAIRVTGADAWLCLALGGALLGMLVATAPRDRRWRVLSTKWVHRRHDDLSTQ